MREFCDPWQVARDHLEGLRYADSLLTGLWGEQGIPAAHGQAIRLPCCGDANDVNPKVQVPHHAPDDLELLEVLPAKHSDIGLHDVEQLGHNLQPPSRAMSAAAK